MTIAPITRLVGRIKISRTVFDASTVTIGVGSIEAFRKPAPNDLPDVRVTRQSKTSAIESASAEGTSSSALRAPSTLPAAKFRFAASLLNS